jgi:hypothetical protein
MIPLALLANAAADRHDAPRSAGENGGLGERSSRTEIHRQFTTVRALIRITSRFGARLIKPHWH